jgi:beta-lactamase regulating signal transducer with metallopeptidase domain
MANDILSLMLELQVAASAAILAVMLLRPPVRAAFGPGAAYALWAAVPLAVLGALAPARAVSIPVMAQSVLPEAVAQTPDVAGSADGASAIASFGRAAGGEWSFTLAPALLVLWAAGCVALAALFVLREAMLRRRLGALTADPRGVPVWIAQAAAFGPMLIGVLSPRIVVPADFRTRFNPAEQRLAIAHEEAHRRGGDTRVLAIVAALRCLAWFNPLVHWGAAALRLDQERARDAAAVRVAGSRREYGAALLKFQAPSCAGPVACTLPADGEALRHRLLALRVAPPGRMRALAGGVLAAMLCAGAGAGVWAAQEPRTVVRETGEAIPQDVADTALGVAVGQGDSDLVRRLLAGGASPDAWTRNGDSMALLDAVGQGDTGLASALLEAGADANAWLPGDPHALMRAARQGDMRMAGLLLDHGADPDFHARGDGTALIAAVGAKHHRMIDLLLDRGADVNAAAPGEGSALTVASAIGELDVVTRLIDRGADVNGYVPGDETPLINAARNGEVLAMRALVDHGADINLTVAALPGDRPPMRSPLGEARRFRQTQAIAYLESLGAHE